MGIFLNQDTDTSFWESNETEEVSVATPIDRATWTKQWCGGSVAVDQGMEAAVRVKQWLEAMVDPNDKNLPWVGSNECDVGLWLGK